MQLLMDKITDKDLVEVAQAATKTDNRITMVLHQDILDLE